MASAASLPHPENTGPISIFGGASTALPAAVTALAGPDAEPARFVLQARGMKANATEVMVIDAPHRAALALEAYRPRHERAHLICRWPDERMSAFAHRVKLRLNAIKRGAEIAALTLVLGGDPDFDGWVPELGKQLAETIAPTGSVTLVGLGASQTDVVEWVDALREMVDPSVTLGAWFPQLLVA